MSPTVDEPALECSVVIVSFNTRDLTLACIDSVFQETSARGSEVIVVDNASEDGSAEAIRQRHPQVKLIECEENLGFARANNLAAEFARGRYLLLLNPDTVVLKRAIEVLVRFMDEHPECGACGGRTWLGDGSLDPGSCWGRITPWSALCEALALNRLFPRSRLFDPESLGAWQRDSIRKVDIIAGCLLIIRRELWEELEGFDPRFFMYCEDADLGLRIREAGSSSWICPDAEIIHYCGASEPVRADKMVRMFAAKNLLFRKHWSPRLAGYGIWTLKLHTALRLAIFSVLRLMPQRRNSYDAWKAIWNRRIEWTHPVRP